MIIDDALSTNVEELAQRVELLISRATPLIVDEDTLGDLARLGLSVDLLRRECANARAINAHLPSKELAHAMRNPLAAIIGYSEILIDESDASLGNDLTAICSSAIDILELISQVIADAGV